MNTLRAIAFLSLFALTAPLQAQEGHEHHGGAPAEAPAQDSTGAAAPSPAPAPAAKSGGDKCKMGMGGKMSHGGGMGGMGKGMKGGGSDDTAALQQRINELEKRLDLMQLLLQREGR